LDLGFIQVNGKQVRAIENMSELAIQNFDLFYRYAIQDARIPVFFIHKVRDIQRSLFLVEPDLGNSHLSPEKKEKAASRFIKDFFSLYTLKSTLTKIGADYLKDVVWRNLRCKFYDYRKVVTSRKKYNPNYIPPKKPNHSLNWKDMLGIKGDTNFVFPTATAGTGKPISKQPRVESKDRYFESIHDSIPLMKGCYYGGRNEQFFYGVSPKEAGTIYDYDLVSAYPTAMLCVGRIDWLRPVDWRDVMLLV
jgi:hypothetical protein